MWEFARVGEGGGWVLPVGFAEKMERLLGAEFEAFLASYDRPDG